MTHGEDEDDLREARHEESHGGEGPQLGGIHSVGGDGRQREDDGDEERRRRDHDAPERGIAAPDEPRTDGHGHRAEERAREQAEEDCVHCAARLPQRRDRVQDDLGRERGVGGVGLLGGVVADPVLAGDEHHRARHALGDAHRVVGGARSASRPRLAGLRRGVLERADDAPVERRSRAASGAPRSSRSCPAAALRSTANAASRVGDAAEALVLRAADVEREARLRGDRVDQPRVDLDLAHGADRAAARLASRAARARAPSRRARSSGRAEGPSASPPRGRRGP